MAREHRTQEEVFLADLRRQIPLLAADVIDAEVEGHPHYDARTTGAADAVRAATSKAKGAARKASDRAGAAAETAAEATDGMVAAARKVPGEVEGELRGASADGDDEHAISGDDGLAISGYDELTVEQILPKLKLLSADELAAVDGYERAGRSRKRVLNRTSALRTTKVDDQLAKL